MAEQSVQHFTVSLSQFFKVHPGNTESKADHFLAIWVHGSFKGLLQNAFKVSSNSTSIIFIVNQWQYDSKCRRNQKETQSADTAKADAYSAVLEKVIQMHPNLMGPSCPRAAPLHDQYNSEW